MLVGVLVVLAVGVSPAGGAPANCQAPATDKSEEAGQVKPPADWLPPSLESSKNVTKGHNIERLTENLTLNSAQTTWFGGLWLSPEESDLDMYMGIVADDSGSVSESRLSEVAERVTACGLALDDFKIVPVQFSLSKISEAFSWLKAVVDSPLNLSSPTKIAPQIELQKNRVLLMAGAPAARNPWQGQIVDDALARFGDVIAVADSWVPAMDWTGCNSDFCDPPLRAGVRVLHPANGTCTLGFPGRSLIDLKDFVFTAGHCVRSYQLGAYPREIPYTFFVDGTDHNIGPAQRYDLSTDWGTVRIANPAGWQMPEAYVYVQDSADTNEDQEYFIWDVQSVGYKVKRRCVTGAILGSDCGTLGDYGLTRANPAGTLTYGLAQIKSLCGFPGDSGAPVFSDHVAFGLMVGKEKDECIALYASLSASQSESNVSIWRYPRP